MYRVAQQHYELVDPHIKKKEWETNKRRNNNTSNSVTFFWFDIGLPYLAHGSITKRGCVMYIHDPDWMLTFDLQVNFIGFCHVFMSNL